MKTILITGLCSCLLILFAFSSGADSFRKTQLKAPKVQVAYAEKWEGIKTRLHEMHIDTQAFRIFIRIFKADKKIELWARSKSDKSFQLYRAYPICASSGELGPKRRQGDGQVPEGFYSISVFNPYSNYYVSLGISYPNKADRIWGGKGDLGGAIMIHGNCVTIGCVPLTDEIIKEVYVLAAEAKNSGQADIPVHLFPTALTAANMDRLEKNYAFHPDLLRFWKNLKQGYDYFEAKQSLPEITIAATGDYIIR